MKDIALGTLEPVFPDNEVKKCFICKKNVYFSSKWDWKKKEPCCEKCLVREKLLKRDLSNIIITQETEKGVMERLGIDEFQLDIMISRMKESLSRKVKSCPRQ